MMNISNYFRTLSQLSFRIFMGFVLALLVCYVQTTFSQEFEYNEANGWFPHPNGDGLVHRNADVSPDVYVGKNAKVHHGAIVTGGIIDGHAEVASGVKMSGGRIGGHAIVGHLLKNPGYLKITGGRIDGHAVVRGGTILSGWIGGNAEIEGGRFDDSVKIFGGRIYGGDFRDNVFIDKGVIDNGRFNGDVKVSGGYIKDGTIGGNAEITGGSIESGNIRGDAKIEGGRVADEVRIEGGTVKGGELSENVRMTGGTVEGGKLSGYVQMTDGRIKDGVVTDNVRFSGGTMEGGYIDGWAEISGGTVKNGFVGGNAKVSGGSINGGRVAGNVHITSGTVRQGMNLTSGTFSKTTALQNLRRNLAKLGGKLVKGSIGVALALATAGSEVVKGETHIFEVPAHLADESVLDAGIINSDTVKYTIDDILEELKTSVQELDPTKAFSEERQMLHNSLRTLYTDVQVDTGLSDEEKERHLKTIAEIQDIVQPPSPPRNPPSRRNRARSQPAQGLQGSLDSGDVKQEHTDNLRQEQPTRGIASTGMCLSGVDQTISHQCLQQCACLLMQSNPSSLDANQKSVNQEVQP